MKGPHKVLLSKLGTLKKGGAILREKLRPEGAAVILYGDIYTKYAEIVTNLVSRVDPSAVVDGVRLNDGDIVFAGSGETAEEIGKCIAYVGKEEAYAGGDVVILSNHGQDARYLGYALNAEDAIRQKMRLGQGSSVMHLYKDDVGGILIPLPPLAEQRKIAEILRTWDEAIEIAEAELKAKQERKRWLMQAVLSGSLRLKGCNKAWEKKRLDQVGTIVPGGTPSTSIPEYWNGDVPWVTPTEITKLKTPYIYNTEALITSEGVRNSSAALLPADSLIVCTRATVGVCAINKVPMTTNQGFKSVVPESTDDTLFLYYVLNSMQSTFNRLAQGSTFLEISKTQFEKITIIWPSAEERRLISSLMRTCDEQIESIGEAIEVLRAQKRGLMQKLLTGEVRVAA
jgi:type I restriction enzyme S subunit